MHINKGILALATAAVMGTGQAQALVFDLTGADAEAPSFSQTVAGVTLTVTPTLYNDLTDVIGSPGADDVVTRNGDGMGVDRFDVPGFWIFPPSEGDPPELNGSIEGSEMLVLTFSEAVLFEALTFGEVDSDDDFDFALDGVFSPTSEDIAIPLAGTYSFGPGVVGTTLGIGADTILGVLGGGDDFRLASVTVSVGPGGPDPTVTPAPSVLATAGVGLAALGFVGIRHRRMARR